MFSNLNEPLVLMVDFSISLNNKLKSAITNYSKFVCARLVQLVRSLTANQEVPGSIPGLVEG